MIEKMLQSPVDYSTLFIDMNSFFASVEQQYNPTLRGRPVAVCAGLSDSSTIIAASIEAKFFGIKTGTKVDEAKLLYPNIKLISDSPVSYREVHFRIMEILNQTRARVVPKSIDEAYLKIPSYLISKSYVFALAKAIKALIKKHVGEYLNCSIGIGPNIWISKMAASSKKPDGLVCVVSNDLLNFYSNLKLVDFNGISFRLACQFYNLGIYNGLDLFKAPFSLLRKSFGVNGIKWYLRLQGYEVDDLRAKQQKTIGHQSTIMPKPAKTIEELKAIVTKMSYRIGYRLRKNNLQARGIVIYSIFLDGTYWEAKYKSEKAINSNFEVSKTCLNKLANLNKFKPVKRVYITAFGLQENLQLPNNLFDNSLRFNNLSSVIDKINLKFGSDTIIPASSLNRSIVPDKIGFGNI